MFRTIRPVRLRVIKYVAHTRFYHATDGANSIEEDAASRPYRVECVMLWVKDGDIPVLVM